MRNCLNGYTRVYGLSLTALQSLTWWCRQILHPSHGQRRFWHDWWSRYLQPHRHTYLAKGSKTGAHFAIQSVPEAIRFCNAVLKGRKHWSARSLAHSLTHSLVRSLTYIFIHNYYSEAVLRSSGKTLPPNHSLTHPILHSLVHTKLSHALTFTLDDGIWGLMCSDVGLT